MFKGPVISGSLKDSYITHHAHIFYKPKLNMEDAHSIYDAEPDCETLELETYRFVQVCSCGSGFWEVT